VTGATLLLRNLFPTATNKQVVTCLVSSADRTVTPARPNANINGGVLNVMAAYECLGGSLNPPPPAVKLDCKSPQQVKVPACVNQAAGKLFVEYVANVYVVLCATSLSVDALLKCLSATAGNGNVAVGWCHVICTRNVADNGRLRSPMALCGTIK
jgi:hypothetical protein